MESKKRGVTSITRNKSITQIRIVLCVISQMYGLFRDDMRKDDSAKLIELMSREREKYPRNVDSLL